MKLITIISSLLLALSATPAFAYIDPGSGSTIMSAIVGFIVAASLGLKTYWYKLKGLFIKPKPDEDEEVSDASEN